MKPIERIDNEIKELDWMFGVFMMSVCMIPIIGIVLAIACK